MKKITCRTETFVGLQGSVAIWDTTDEGKSKPDHNKCPDRYCSENKTKFVRNQGSGGNFNGINV
ncbi:MAG: hypothetical protein M0P47_12485 [Bacteroidales bacterium]|nr:hypothetical protein [Bacteroidales bacterium]